MSIMTRTRPGPTSDSPTPVDPAAAANPPGADAPWTQRTVEAITARLSGTGLKRRSFLTRAALVGSALAVDPIGFVFKPRTAWAAVCGDANECSQGWSAFCATINNGANTCPSGSYVAGWWKIDNTTFCSGRARYIVDCNRTPGSSCSCRCANGDCDRRRVCCNNFRYGQCNTQIRGTTEVVCRIVLCTPPWEWGNCTTTSLTSNGTRTHWSSRLPSRANPTPIMVYWLEAGLTGSVFGDLVGSERPMADGGAWAQFQRSALTSTPQGLVRYIRGPHAEAFIRLGGATGGLNRPLQSIVGTRPIGRYIDGSTYMNRSDAWGAWGPADLRYRQLGDHRSWMGPPKRDMVVDGPYSIIHTESKWKVVHSTTSDVALILRSINELPGDGSFPDRAIVRRWEGAGPFATATKLSREAYPDGASTVILVRGDRETEATVAGAIATRLGAPILFTHRNGIPQVTVDEIQRLAPTQGIVVGDAGIIPGATARELRALTGDNEVRRLAGGNRVETAADVSRYADPDGNSDTVFLVNVNEFQDIVAVAPLVHQRNGVVLLVGQNRLPKVVATELWRINPSDIVLVGPQSAIGSNVVGNLRRNHRGRVSRIEGKNHHDTSAAIAREMGGSGGDVVVATTNNFTDALGATSWANPRGAPIILINKRIGDAVDAELMRRRPRRFTLVGPPDAISSDVSSALRAYVHTG